MDYFIGDLHFGDKDIIHFGRGQFKTLDNMEKVLIKNWRANIKPSDTVYVNGDFFDAEYTTKEHMKEILSQLTGKIVVIKGNHDIGLEEMFKELGVELCNYPILYKEWYIVSHEPLFITEASPYANIYAHVHNSPTYKDVSSRSICTSADRINFTPISFDEIKRRMKKAREN